MCSKSFSLYISFIVLTFKNDNPNKRRFPMCKEHLSDLRMLSLQSFSYVFLIFAKY
uniref:Uncharacterized protein n=1 Tax=Manihot esculenta TaxID=3983 RepID=A0A2C9VZ59_MANES